MIKKIAWNTFKSTGDINTFLEFKQIQNIEAQINMQQQMEVQNGNNQNEWYNKI